MATTNVILGITGGIAAYKTPDLVRRLREQGAEVQVVMTQSAREFVTETSLQAVSGRQVRANLWDREAEAAMGHIELARWADVVLIAPATAEIMARLAHGSAGDLLTTLCLATEAPIVMAPAMNRVMWANPAVQANRTILAERGVRMLGPASGSQACGETGEGRMLEPRDIAAAVLAETSGELAGRTVLITAGPTREPLDPVRYLSNRSSGKMGYALAAAARDAGADVILVTGPVALEPPPGVDTIAVETAEAMYGSVHDRVAEADIFIAAAAVADYRPVSAAGEKIKKSAPEMAVELTRTRDILASVAALPRGPFSVGFAAETDRLEEYAIDKLEAKRLDMIVANRVGGGLGFEADENAVEIFWRGGSLSLPTAPKTALARQIVSAIARRYRGRQDFPSRPGLTAV